MVVSEPDGRKYENQPVTLVSPSQEQLAEYSGVFFSDELLASYRFAVREGNLYLQVNNRGWEQLDPTTRDRFISHLRTRDDGRVIQFLRDDRDHVNGVMLSLVRIQDLRLEKQNAD